jgi:hypothetical protein
MFWIWRRWAYMGQFNAQDQWMIESMSIPPERLYRPDASITAWRKLVEDVSRGGRAQTDEALATAAATANRALAEDALERDEVVTGA